MALFAGILDRRDKDTSARAISRRSEAAHLNQQNQAATARVDSAIPNRPQQPNPEASHSQRLLDMIGSRPESQAGDQTIAKIIRALALMGGNYGAASMLTQRMNGNKRADAERQAAWDAAYRVASLPGMNERELAAYLANPEQWGSHMADALSTHHAAANVGQTETRVFGNPATGGTTFQPPRIFENGVDQVRYDPSTGQTSTVYSGMTDGEQYARSLGIEPGTAEWAGALQDEMLRGSGPTAHNYHMQLENARQSGRMQLRQTPTPARSTSRPRAPGPTSARPTATAPDGRVMEWNGKAWRLIR